ncbi:arylsulfatase [Colwellia chukchiensis]|uniref:Arylsulfatase n=1 Tax=Colwellia chukchiensis TaxID=641665 RepID=A0A1H7KQB7_9GAMM|nr:arylsulfatase [Colwellia chukchiensis]SEK88928.1 arylsulfatase [Colwellia chukchiensis]
MIPIRLILAMLLVFISSACAKHNDTDSTTTQPNILLIVADDLGYSDLGSFGGEIDTPNLDKLATSGLQLTNFYAAPTCSPSRAMLLSGMDNHLVGLGTQKYYWSEEQKGRPGYEGFLNERFVTLATRLKDAGYRTYMAGKWHLGYDETTYPSARGFEESFALLEGGASHFDQRGVIPNASKANYRKNGKAVALPKDFFSSAFYTDRLIENIESNRKDGQPFFAYAAYTAPHWPLQAPEENIAKYKGKYDAGYEAIIAARLQRMKELDLIANVVEANPGAEVYPTWDELTATQKKHEARLMEIYAGMVDALDLHIGRLINYLEETGQLENTIIVFMSDNGAEGANPLDIEAGKNEPNATWIPNNFDNSDDNLGKAGSFVSTGPGWARVSSTPSRLYKGFTTEGGIKVPAFIYYPQMARSKQKSSEFVSVMDVAPTLMELAGLDPKSTRYQERTVLPMTGTSLLGYLQEQQTSVHGENFSAAWELFGRRAVRLGDWKMVWLNEPWGNGRWQLYNLAQDPAEKNDLYHLYPKIVHKLKQAWHDYVKRNDMVVVDKVDILYSNGTSHYKGAQVSK